MWHARELFLAAMALPVFLVGACAGAKEKTPAYPAGVVAAQPEDLVNKEDADYIFSLKRQEWEDYARAMVHPWGWEIRRLPFDTGTSIVAQDPGTNLGLVVQPFYSRDDAPPDRLIVGSFHPEGLLLPPKIDDDLRRDIEDRARKDLGPLYAVSVTITEFMGNPMIWFSISLASQEGRLEQPIEPSTATTAEMKMSPLRFMTPYEWAGASEEQQRIYIAGALETWSFFLYGYFHSAIAQEISDFVACVHNEKLDDFIVGLWLFGDVEKSVAEHIFKIAPIVCGKYEGKGDKSGEPLQVLSRQNWSAFDLSKKATYVMAYLEMSEHLHKGFSEASRGVKPSAEEEKLLKELLRLRESLNNCLAGIGFDGVLSQVLSDESSFEWRYPLPWSIAKSLGRACKSYR